MLRLEALTTADQFDPKSFHDFGVHFGNRSHEANWPGALSLLETESWPDLIRNAVSACSKAKQWSQALLLFEEATELRVVDLATYTSAIFACKQANLWQHGISLLCNLRKQELQADAMTLAAAAGACERGLQWQQALALLRTARDAQRESALISNTVMNAMANSQQWPQALLLLAETHKRRLQSFLITRNAVVAACSRSSEWLSAVQLLQNFQRERLQVDVFTYNNALSACVKSHKWQQTLQLFQDLRQQRLDEAVMPYEFAVSACGKGDQWQLGLELTNSMLERKFEVHPITRSVAIGMCQQCGADVSELVLRLLDDSDNVMLNGKALNVLAKSSWQRGLQLLQSMVRRKVADKISYVSMMSVFETTGNWRQALQLLQDVRQEGVEVDPLLFSVAINACENAQQWPFALALLKEGGGDLHSHSFTYVASLQALGNQMQWEQVLMFLEEVEDRFAADVKVQSAAVNACALGSWEAAWCLLQGMQAKHLPTQYATSALMKSAAQATEWALALHLFHSTDTMDLVGFNSALGACQVAHLWEEALGLLQKMQDSELQADQVSYSSAISTCGKALHWQHALQLMTAVPAESAVFNAVINAFGRSSEWRRALLVFDKIPKVDLISYNSLINACAKGTERDVALQLFRQLPSAHLAPDLFTFGALMTAINDGNQALALLRELEDFPSLKANVVTYTAAMAACGRGRQWSEALELFGEMKDSGISPSVISFNTAMEACDDHWQHSLALLRDMRNPNSFSYSASMSCCALANAWPVALQLLQEADERDFEAEEMLVLRNLLIGACGEEWTVALDLVDNFYHRQVATSIVTYTTLMDITRKAWQWEYTLHIFNDLRRRQVEADGRACSSVIMSIANAKQWPSAFALMEQLEERRVEVDYSTGYQVVLDAYMSSIS